MGQGPYRWKGSGRKKKNPFPDLVELPPEVAVKVLSYLNATELCLAGCVNEKWQLLANVETLWKNLCYSRWRWLTLYNPGDNVSFKDLYMTLDTASLTFSFDPEKGIGYLFQQVLLRDSANDIAAFLYHSPTLNRNSVTMYLRDRHDVLTELVRLMDLSDALLPNALRYFFTVVAPPHLHDHFLSTLVGQFSSQYHLCNQQLNLPAVHVILLMGDVWRSQGLDLFNETENAINRNPVLVVAGFKYNLMPQALHKLIPYNSIYVISYGLILLSIDLNSVHVKNKMSKREFIRNVRQATTSIPSVELLGHFYDNVYLYGHVAKLR